jgi:hypothetical protein
MKKDTNKTIKILFTGSLIFNILLFVLLIGVFSFFRDMFIEKTCQERAQQITGQQWNKQVTVSDELKNRYPEIVSKASSNGKMQWLLGEELKCEASKKTFFIF